MDMNKLNELANRDRDKKWDFMHLPKEDPRPLKYTAMSFPFANERVTIHFGGDAIEIMPIPDDVPKPEYSILYRPMKIWNTNNPEGIEIDKDGNFTKWN